jgi:hypothetical protein
MAIIASSSNGRTSPAAGPLPDLITRLRNGQSDDTSLLPLFAELTREAGRDDLCREFTRRAASSTLHDP